MTKHKKEIPPQPIGKGLGANLTWLAAYKALNVCAIALTSLIIIVTVILLATTDIFIKEFEPEAIRLIRWEFRLDKADVKNFQLKKWLLNINYKNPFGKITSHQKESDIIL